MMKVELRTKFIEKEEMFYIRIVVWYSSTTAHTFAVLVHRTTITAFSKSLQPLSHKPKTFKACLAEHNFDVSRWLFKRTNFPLVHCICLEQHKQFVANVGLKRKRMHTSGVECRLCRFGHFLHVHVSWCQTIRTQQGIELV